MKKPIWAVLLVAAGLAPLSAQDDPTIDEIACKEALAHEPLLGPPVAEAFTANYDLKYGRFEWDIDPAKAEIAGTATLYFESLIGGFNKIELDFTSFMAIDEVRYHGQPITTFQQDGFYTIGVAFPVPLGAGVLDSVSITYHGQPPATGFGSFAQAAHNGKPAVWTLSEPWGAMDWWPTKIDLGDKLDSIDVVITCPEGNRAASNGSLVSETTDGAHRTFHWKHRYPIAPYLVAFAVTNYAAFDLKVPLSDGSELTMVNYAYPEDLQYAKDGTAELTPVLTFFDSLLTDYPFKKEKYGHAQFGWGGGQEHQTMSFVTNYELGLLAHELGHQWFGDMVTCRGWKHIWLNEGFATYVEGLARERFAPDIWQLWRTTKLASITSKPDGSVRVVDSTLIGSIFNGRLSYSKGAYLLHMLRWRLGDEVFFTGLRAYATAKKHSFATTDEFQEIMEATSGQPLGEFFEDWFTGEGHPSYHALWEQTGGVFSVKIEQSVSWPQSVDFFENPVPLRLTGAGGEKLDVRFDLTASGQVFSEQVGFKVVDVQFDPELWLISANNTVEYWDLTATGEAGGAGAVRLFPNPADEELTVLLGENTGAAATGWAIFDALGQRVMGGENSGTNFSIDTGELAAGPYLLRLTDGAGRTSGRSFSKR